MKIIIKTIKGEVFNIEANLSDKVEYIWFSIYIFLLYKIAEIKQKVQEAKNVEASTQKLIVRGKQTEDAQTLEDLGLKEGDFMVLMVSKVKFDSLLI